MATGNIPVIHTDGMEKWYLTDGISESDVAAAYRFVYQPSWNDAKVNVNNGTKYELTATNAVWSQCGGMILYARADNGAAVNINNSTLQTLSSISSAIYSFSAITNANNIPVIALSDKKWLGTPYHLTSGTQLGHVVAGSDGSFKTTGFLMGRKGILGGNFGTTALYFDGTKMNLNSMSAAPYRNHFNILTRMAGDLGDQAGCSCTALVFYNKDLTDAQHAAIAKNISKLGGIL